MAEAINYLPDPREKPLSWTPSRGYGNSGTGQVYVGRYPSPPDDVTQAAVSYPSGGGAMVQWDVVTQAWV